MCRSGTNVGRLAAVVSASKATQAQVAQRRAKALQLRSERATLDEIREELGYSSIGAVSVDLRRAYLAAQDKLADAAEAYREAEAAKLDALEEAAWRVLERDHVTVSHGKVIQVTNTETGAKIDLLDDKPTLDAIATLLRISESRRKLYGLDSPDRTETGVTVRYEVTGVDLGALS